MSFYTVEDGILKKKTIKTNVEEKSCEPVNLDERLIKLRDSLKDLSTAFNKAANCFNDVEEVVDPKSIGISGIYNSLSRIENNITTLKNLRKLLGEEGRKDIVEEAIEFYSRKKIDSFKEHELKDLITGKVRGILINFDNFTI